jgi:hypothetical protein
LPVTLSGLAIPRARPVKAEIPLLITSWNVEVWRAKCGDDVDVPGCDQ